MICDTETTPTPQKQHKVIVSQDEYNALHRLRQLQRQGVEIAVVVIKGQQIKVRKVGD